MLGVVLVDKPAGRTSHDVVQSLRRTFKTKRIGHAGTLDPLATGLLVVAVGPATRFLQYLPMEPKEYMATIGFGATTATYDLEGEVLAERPVPTDLAAAIEACIERFRGLIQQLPPMYSAVKMAGRPLYAYARAGEQVDREPRTVHIDRFEILEVAGNLAKARIVCSGGTYVRTLAHDLGEAVGCGAHLAALVRTSVGKFKLADAVRFEEVDEDRVVTLREALDPMPVVELSRSQEIDAREGRHIALADLPDSDFVALSDSEGRVFSVARVSLGGAHPECVIPTEVLESSA